ncbi:MAG: nitric-oxide reductase [Planctomycetes bacterium]|nr:nitric-oxide reductase [Planctomycetota bacterium]
MPMNIMKWIDQRKNWWKVFLVIFAISVFVVGRIGYQTYSYAPPIANFVAEDGSMVFSAQHIDGGKKVFLDKVLMDYGSFLGDGGMRGPDFTAEALNLTARFMNDYYMKQDEKMKQIPDDLRESFVKDHVRNELKKNRYDKEYYSTQRSTTEGDQAKGAIVLSPAQVYAFAQVTEFYRQKFGKGGDLVGEEAFKPENYITKDENIRDLSAFFYWGGWLCAAKRPDPKQAGSFYAYSYTHNWPYDPLAGNIPHGGLVLWSVIGTIVVIFTIGLIFYYYGKMDREAVLEQEQDRLPPFATTDVVDQFKPTPTQRAMYKFFAVAAVLFFIQVVAGFLTIGDFIGFFNTYAGFELNEIIPSTVSRAWHTQISVLWIAVCWFAATIWVLPLICRPEPTNQLKWINTLFWMLVVVAVGGAAGIQLNVKGVLGDGMAAAWIGSAGWEFMQLAFLYHIILYASFLVWLIIIVRGLWPALVQKQSWSLPNWMVYAIVGIIFMFTASFMTAGSKNFAVADFWRWCTVHMWVEAFFELFTTIIVAYFLYLMGFVSHRVAARVVYLGAVLFLGSGLIGISHNFYWNGKSMETIALGAAFSSLQIAPLVLLTIEAWRFRHMPQSTLAQLQKQGGSQATFGLGAAFLFLVGVNFWNFMGAGVMGFSLNLPIINYYQHGTYLTVNHAHAALFGVYGNLAIAAMLFCGRWNIGADRWSPRLLSCSFWAMNIGIVLMVVMDLFPVGVHQLIVAMSEQGYAYSRSNAYLHGDVFQAYTWLRAPGALLFFFFGCLPLTYFMVSRWFMLKPAQTREEQFVVPPSVLALAGESSLRASLGAAANPAPDLGDEDC